MLLDNFQIQNETMRGEKRLRLMLHCMMDITTQMIPHSYFIHK